MNFRDVVPSDQNRWATVRFSTPAFTWTLANMFTTRLSTRQTVPAKPSPIILW